MSQEIQSTMIALVVSAFLVGVIVGRWPEWSAKRRTWMLCGGIAALLVVALVWGATMFAGISAHNVTFNVLLSSDQYLKGVEQAGYWARRRDGWNRPFVQRLSIEQEPTAQGGADAGREYLAFEVRSLGPNGVVDDDDMWVLFEVVTASGNLRMVGRQWGGINNVHPEYWNFPREDRNPPPATAPLPPATTDGTMKP